MFPAYWPGRYPPLRGDLMKTFKTRAALTALLVLAANGALAKPTADIKVMTQNQYLGADLTPIIEAGSPEAFNAAVITALLAIGNNNLPARAAALAESVKANVLDTEGDDKTLSGHWPSDHASVSAELTY